MTKDVEPATRHDARFAYPVILDLTAVRALVVGAGRVGSHKAAGLAAAGANVTVVAPEVSDHLDREGVVAVVERPFIVEDLDDVRVVVTATGHRDIDHAVAAAARRRGIWVNAADQPADCDFILPAIARSGRVSVSVSTDGASPALAGRLRDRCAAHLGPRVAAAAETLAADRRRVHARGESTERLDWSARVSELLDGPTGRDHLEMRVRAAHP